MKNKKLGFLKLLLLSVIVIFLNECSGENEDSDRPPSSDENSRAISPKKEYTKDSPAEWKEFANDHLPLIKLETAKTKQNIRVEIPGRNFSERHYIEVIGIMDERSADIDVKYLKRGDKPIALLSVNPKEYDLDTMKVFAKCNLHDLWTTPLITPP